MLSYNYKAKPPRPDSREKGRYIMTSEILGLDEAVRGYNEWGGVVRIYYSPSERRVVGEAFSDSNSKLVFHEDADYVEICAHGERRRDRLTVYELRAVCEAVDAAPPEGRKEAANDVRSRQLYSKFLV
jgi:hypothetical protein